MKKECKEGNTHRKKCKKKYKKNVGKKERMCSSGCYIDMQKQHEY
jgi:hypothetical protein